MNQMKNIQGEASVFLDHAMALKHVANSNNDMEKIAVLDANLKLWVEIEMTIQDSDNVLPEEIKKNLIKLSKFVEQKILSQGVNMNEETFNCLSNINMQISKGLLESIQSTVAKEEAISLLKCAIDIATAKDNKNDTDLVNALDSNLKLWVYIKTMASSKKSSLPEGVKSNLIKLSDYVSAQTLKVGKNLDSENFGALESLISTNLQISEGLMSKEVA